MTTPDSPNSGARVDSEFIELARSRAMGREHDLGTVAEGKLADLVALGADPLADPCNYQRVRWVMNGGVLLPRPR